jgi:hypothetical protein
LVGVFIFSPRLVPCAGALVASQRFGLRAQIKESTMRRILSALLVSVITVVVPLAPPAGAASVRGSVKPVVGVARGSLHPPRQGARANLSTRIVAATRHVLVADAASVRVTISRLRAEWQLVAVCEVGGNWSMTGAKYSGIGFSNATWTAYGGAHYAPLAGQASRDEQILIGMKVTNGRVPDQDGCSTTGW